MSVLLLSIFRSKPWIIPFAFIVGLFFFVATFAPLLAFGMPLVVCFNNEWYFPLGRYLLYKEAFSKPVDLFFNYWMITWPLIWILWHRRSYFIKITGHLLLLIGLIWILEFGIRDPSSQENFEKKTSSLNVETSALTWDHQLEKMNGYARLKLVWTEYRQQNTSLRMKPYLLPNSPTPYEVEQTRRKNLIQNLSKDDPYRTYLIDREEWIKKSFDDLQWWVSPLIRDYFWEETTDIDQSLNQQLPWYERARINRKDLFSGLIYGSRISFVVGILAVMMSMFIGIPFGAISAYLSGYWDTLLMRLIEIWEAFPTFFMLLFITSILQSKSILLVVFVLGVFNWTGFARFVRAEVLRQKQMPFIDAAMTQGLSHSHILFSEILPNSISPVLTLLPFAVMNAISAEAGLSFLGLGEEGSCSWGTLMDEGRLSFPAESYLLWPPAIVLSLVLISIAAVGDSIRDWLDPKLKE